MDRTHPPDCDCAVYEAARGGVDAEGQRMLRELDQLRTTVPGQRIEEPDPEPAGGGAAAAAAGLPSFSSRSWAIGKVSYRKS